jgi:uncharacterized protein (DUF1015 family)
MKLLMAQIQPIAPIHYSQPQGSDLSALIAPPYDVLDAGAKGALLSGDPHNIVAIDLPHLPAKTVGPDPVYVQAGVTYRDWVSKGVLTRRDRSSLFAYQQTFEDQGRSYCRRALMANVRLQALDGSDSKQGPGRIYPHEQTFAEPREDRLKLMRATGAQLSPIFGLYDHGADRDLPLGAIIDAGDAMYQGTTTHDQVLHELWAIDDAQQINQIVAMLAAVDVFIADGHHRYNTALTYRQELIDADGPLPQDHPAQFCMFVLVSMADPGLIVRPTHRVLGNMAKFSFERFVQIAAGRLNISPFAGGDMAALEARLPSAGPHAVGLYNPADTDNPLSIATCVEDDPLLATHSQRSAAWRSLDVAIVQHLIVEQVCQPALCQAGATATWQFPHTLSEVKSMADRPDNQLGLIMQPTALESIRRVCRASELMPQKSTFFYPKLATGLIINSVSGEL